ncbi:ATP-binding protein [Anaeromyxobacter paludicola]|uniref:histidine kinase n=1 Tax=Anaeromyxobacter paludicola TaxID=2918171 RepID=A0ABM7XBJ2_9BACT|nr:ATP-binding protein [Anaeromyxobacter paludicola]BDG09229.1 hypothetical protein AMPC_23420 [Anaeromyxobacter paludicola]
MKLESDGSALVESERRLRTVVSAVTAGIVFKDRTGAILECNPAAESILGITRDPGTGQLAADPRIGAIREDGTPYRVEDWPVFEAIRTGRPARDAVMGFTQPGAAVRWVRVNAVPLAEPGAAPYAAVVLLDDISAEREAGLELRRRERRLNVALECAGHYYWEEDIASGRFVAGQPWTLLGYAPGEIEPTSRAWLALGYPGDEERRKALKLAHLEGRSPSYRAEYRARARDGSWRWLLTCGRALRDEPGGAVMLAGTITDITESKQLESQLRHADRLASVGTLAAGVAHEVNNPLTYVMANLDFVDDALARAEAGEGPAVPASELRVVIGEAAAGAERVKQIVKGLRHFVRAPRSPERHLVDPRLEVDAAIALARHEVTARAELRVDVPEELPRIVAGEHEISQVLVNLLMNAGQAIPEGHAGSSTVSLSATVAGERVCFTVRDTGTGIPDADLSRIFDPFFTTKPVGSGTGLGLSVCHGIVTSLGGTIEVTTELGHGSTFRVCLPVAPAQGQELAAPVEAPTSARGRVLIIDDEPLVARGMARLLAKDHEVAVAGSAADALKRIHSGESWDVILCDLMMPQMDGVDFEAALATSCPALVPRIVFITGGAFTERAQAFLAGDRRRMYKPVVPSELRALIASMLMGR